MKNIAVLLPALTLASALLVPQPIAAQAYASIEAPALPAEIPSTITAGLTRDGSGSDEESVANDEIAAILAEAEALYATGVIANLDGRWHDAQVSFEQAIALLGELDAPIENDTDSVSVVDRLLGEIVADYRQTLIALGELDADASMSAVLLRFEEVTLGTAPDVIETDQIEAPVESEPVTYDFPIELNDKVRNCIVYYQTVAREPLERFLVRAGRYLPMMKEIAASYGLPT
ncbi:MAG TPA: hypothetical protein VM118_10465, partial [Acidobacteriota bacterium]|nr:hypothetical protein [Acidobacteriota bacterium]